MRPKFIHSQSLKNFLLHALVYLLWFANSMVCVAALIQLRSTVNVFWVALGGDRYTASLVNQVSVLLGGFIIFVYVIFLEGHYRECVSDRLTDSGPGILLRRFLITTAIPLGGWIVCLSALEIALRILVG